jgi:tetratricopeptide (TPR) repeat protein
MLVIAYFATLMKILGRLLPAALIAVCVLSVHAQNAVPVTTRSAAARRLYEDAISKAENFHNTDAEAGFIKATKADPNFALAHGFAALLTRDPQVEQRHIARAKALAGRATKGEQLFVNWITAQKENDFVAAIAAMNDFTAMFPQDKRSLFFFSKWLLARGNNERCISLIENTILKTDPDYVPALNELGYAYSYLGEHDKAIAAMRRTTELRPQESNPHDSLAELLRLSGRYEEALQHYREANRILADFSVLGVADTLSLMGRYQEARAEFARGAAIQPALRDALDYKFQSAVSYVHERDFAGADKAFSALIAEAHKAGMADVEIDAHRAMAMYARQHGEALAHLASAEQVLQHPHTISRTTREEALAQILRMRAVVLPQAGRQKESEQVVERLAEMANKTRNDVVQRSYHAAKGSLLNSAGKFAEAVPELQEDRGNALSHRELIMVLEKSGSAEEARSERDAFRKQHRVLIEDAIVRSSESE